MKRTTRAFALVVLAGSLAGAMIVPALAGPLLAWRPDGMIRGGAASDYHGNDIYNDTAEGQTMHRKMKPGYSDRFRFKYENDGALSDVETVAGDPSAAGFTIEYFQNGEDITTAVTTGGYYSGVPTGPDDSPTISMLVSSKKSAKPGSSHTFLLDLYSDRGSHDFAAVEITIKPGAGDHNSESSIA